MSATAAGSESTGEGAITAKEIERAVAQGLTRASRNRFFHGEDTRFALTGSSILVNINEVLDGRSGSVLDNRSILKTDFVPSQNTDNDIFPIKINGTYHLRQSASTQIFGVAQPTIAGIRGILNLLGAGRLNSRNGGTLLRKSVLWINLREEPTLYVNGRSTVLRERNEPFHNIDQLQGINPKRIRDLEVRLKEDLVEEASKYNGNVVLHEEKDRRELEGSWEAVTLDDILTPDEVFFSFNMQGYRVQYVRIPTTPEKAPTPKFFDSLLKCLMDTPPLTNIVLNCQTGVSRSTIGMIAGGLIQMWRGLIEIPKQVSVHSSSRSVRSLSDASSDNVSSHFFPHNTIHEGDETEAEESQEENSTTNLELPLPIPQPPLTPTKSRRPHIVRVLSGAALSSLEESLDMQSPVNRGYQQEFSSNDAISRQLEAGWYQPTLNLLRLVDRGREAKKHVDFFCEDASHLVNLRSHIFVQRSRASRERHQPSEMFKIHRAATALMRYLMLITFDAYLAAQVDAVMNRQAGAQSPFVHHHRGDSAGSARFLGEREPESAFPVRFSDWLRNRPEIVRLLESVESEPMLALEALDLPSSLGLEDASSGLRQDMREAMEARRGSMLNTDTILKADHFPGGFAERHQVETPAAIRGAPNFRNVEGTRVYGVCTPTVDAASSIIRYIQTASNAKKIVWTNLREEPVVYINKQPYVLRSVKQPFRNVNEFVMIDSARLEAAELRLKQDILNEAKRYKGRILVHTESDDRSLQLLWESITEEDVMTPREMYESLVESGLPVDYARVPLTPEQPPSPLDVEHIIARVREAKSQAGAHFVFNCQLGRGRSTTAMVIALLELQRVDDPTSEFLEDIVAFGSKGMGHQYHQAKSEGSNRQVAHKIRSDTSRKQPPQGSNSDDEDAGSVKNAPRPASPAQYSTAGAGESSDEEDYRRKGQTNNVSSPSGDEEYSVILSLVRVLSNGVIAKKWADNAIDQCGAVENIRRNILENLERANTSRTLQRSEEFIQRGLLNLRRYFMLILIAAYQICYAKDCKESFSRWYYRRPELKTIFNEIQSKDALKASTDKVLSGPPPSEHNELAAAEKVTTEEAPDARLSSISQFIARRDGMVLTRGSILKSDHFPGCNRLKGAKVVINGAPNFREIVTSDDPNKSVGIYGTGIPTVEGLRAVLEFVSKQRNGRKSIVWVNLREEPILYVNGRPFVLRKLEHPFENLEHTGISKDRVEDMEARLKVDVINEIISNKGRLLVHDEDESGLQPVWETVDISEGSTSVQTPRDLYAMLARNYKVKQFRVPITDEQAPKVIDYDDISNIVRTAPVESEIVFNCQMGRGRTTTGLVIACAVRLWEKRMLWSFSETCEKLIGNSVINTKRKVKSIADNEEGAQYLMGQYEAITTLTRVLDQGNLAKSTTDAVIDTCDALQNLREAIVSLRELSLNEEKSAMQRAAALNRGVHYLRRYYQLIEFVDYLFSSSPEDRTRIKTFAAWLRERRELKTIIRKVTLD